MAVWRLSALSSGTSAKSAPALLPVPSVDAGAKNSREQVFGYPGTRPIPAPAPMPGSDRTNVSMALEGNIGLPSSTFSVFYPSLYWVNSHERAPVSRLSDNQMPVPALLPSGQLPPQAGGLASGRGTPEGVVFGGARFRGQNQVRQPRVTPSYPSKLSGRQ